jgi:hypothetical protein
MDTNGNWRLEKFVQALENWRGVRPRTTLALFSEAL